MEKDKNKQVVDNQEDYLLKKIRYYQGSIDDFETFWNKKIADGEKEESKETKDCKVKNAELNKAFEIIPVEDDSKKEETKPADNTPEEKKKKEDKSSDEKKDKEDDKKEKEKKSDDENEDKKKKK